MVWVHCRLTHSIFLYFVDKNRMLLSVSRYLIDTCHKKGETFSFFPTVWLHCGACCEWLVWFKTHLYDSTFLKNTGQIPAKALWAITVPIEWTGAWAFATLTSLCQCPGLFFKDQQLCGMILEFHCNEWALYLNEEVLSPPESKSYCFLFSYYLNDM